MNTKTIITIVVVVVVALIGYWLIPEPSTEPSPDGASAATTTGQVNQMTTNSGENPQPGSAVHDLPVEPAAAAARKDLAASLGVSEGSVVILLVEKKTWNDGCLGLGGPAESCLQALVEGYRVELTASGKTYVYRTDATGASARAE